MDLSELYPDFDAPEFDGLLATLEDKEFTTSQVLTCKTAELSQKCGRSLNEVTRFKTCLMEFLESTPPPQIETADNILDQQLTEEIFTTGDKGLDQFFGGGIRTKCVTELVGEAGCGKSHILTQLAFTVQLLPEEGGLARAAIYVTTEAALPKVRLDDFERVTGGSTSAILVYKCSTFDQLEQCLMINVPRAVQQFDVGLVVIDSIAQPFRGMNLRETQKKIRPMVDTLKAHAHGLNFAIVVSNQVTSVFPTSFTIEVERNPLQADFQSSFHSGWNTNTVTWKSQASQPSQPPSNRESRIEPALRPYCGNAWTLAVDVRVALKRSPDRKRRTAQVVFSPWIVPHVCQFEIYSDGVRAVENS